MSAQTTSPSAPVEMTMAEWQKTHRDFKGIYNGQRCVLRMTARGTCLVPVKIVKEGK